MSIYYIVSFIIPFLTVLLFMPLVRRTALRVGFIDAPSARKIHVSPVPLGGGLPIFAGFLLTIVILSSILIFPGAREAKGILAGSILIFLIGIYDDAFEMGALPKMLGQIMAAIIFLSFTQGAPIIVSFPVYMAVGIFWIVGIQNAMNFLDNMDGLCAGVALSIAIGLGILFVFKDMSIYAFMSLALAGGALGFLRYNLPPASIFLGDTGSLLFGFVLSCLTIVHINSSRDMTAALAPFIIMAYPIFDTTFVTISRLNEGRKVYIGGKDHSSHRINYMGLTRKATVFIILAINMLMVAFGILLYFMSGSPYQMLSIVMLAFVLAFIGTHLYKNVLFFWQRVWFLLADFLSLNIAMLSYILVRYWLGAPEMTSAFAFSDLAWINIFWIILYSAGGLYDLGPESRLRDHIRPLARLIISGAAVFAIANFQPGTGFQISLISLLLFSAILFCISGISRAILLMAIGKISLLRKKRMDAVIVRPSSECCISNLNPFRTHYNILGYIGAPGPADLEYLGDIDALSSVLHDKNAARIILDLSEKDFGDLSGIFGSAFYMDTSFLITNPAAENFRGLRKLPTRFEDIYIVAPGQRRIFHRIVRRISDFALSGMALILSSPWIAYKILSERNKHGNFSEVIAIVGRSGKEICIKSFAQGGGRGFRNPWGLLAVFKGHLSLVGPTISTPDMTTELQGFWRKLYVKPGLFGPGYCGLDRREQFELDLKYVEHPSLLNELLILIRQILKFSQVRDIGLKDA